jgi:hypothetical protein
LFYEIFHTLSSSLSIMWIIKFKNIRCIMLGEMRHTYKIFVINREDQRLMCRWEDNIKKQEYGVRLWCELKWVRLQNTV